MLQGLLTCQGLAVLRQVLEQVQRFVCCWHTVLHAAGCFMHFAVKLQYNRCGSSQPIHIDGRALPLAFGVISCCCRVALMLASWACSQQHNSYCFAAVLSCCLPHWAICQLMRHPSFAPIGPVYPAPLCWLPWCLTMHVDSSPCMWAQALCASDRWWGYPLVCCLNIYAGICWVVYMLAVFLFWDLQPQSSLVLHS
jgi:hypothetical protein